MNKASLLASSIRTNCAERLLGTISIPRMHNRLMDLFVDRTAIETSLFESSKERILKNLSYSHCLSLNDERKIKFHQSWKQESYVFDEKRQIWIDKSIDPINDDMFIPRDDAQ